MKLLSTLTRTAAAAAATLAMVGPLHPTAHAQSAALRGEVIADGSSTVAPITKRAASEFREHYPNVDVQVGVSGTGGGFKRFVTGETAISDASRPIKPSEFAAAVENGVQFIEIPIAMDGLTIAVNPKNTFVKQLSVDQLRQIFLRGQKNAKWSDIDPSWPNQTITLYAPGTDSGTFDYFKEVLVEDEETQQFRGDMTTSEDDNVLVTGVKNDDYGIGFFGANYYFNNQEALKAVPIVNPDDNTAYTPSPENVMEGNYAPFSRPLFIYVNAEHFKRPEVRQFVGFFLANAKDLATNSDYVALSDEMLTRAAVAFRDKVTGTHFVTAEGEKRTGPVARLFVEENLVKNDALQMPKAE